MKRHLNRLLLKPSAMICVMIAIGGCAQNPPAAPASQIPIPALTSGIVQVFVSHDDGPMYSSGSGVMVRSGWVVTCAHVADHNAKNVWIKADDSTVQADVVACLPDCDLTLLHISGKQFVLPRSLQCAIPDAGTEVFAVGFSGSLGRMVSRGIIASSGQSNPIGVPCLVVDVTVGPGCSGGALLDSTGRLCGILTSSLQPEGMTRGVAMAIPASMVQALLDRIVVGQSQPELERKNEEISEEPGFLGIRVRPLPENLSADTGLEILEVFLDSPAERSGLMPGMVIRSINGMPAKQPEALSAWCAAAGPGKNLSVELIDSKQTLTVTTGTMKEAADADIPVGDFCPYCGSLVK